MTTPEGITSGQQIAPGAHVRADGVDYCVWAPDHATMQVRVRHRTGGEVALPLERDEAGYFCGSDAAGRAGDRYVFELPDGSMLPDIASRSQPDGVHAWSQCIDPHDYAWRARDWRRPGWKGQSIYELHVGTFTSKGTFLAAIEKLSHLAALGVEAIELMPVADFPGDRNWGYDGVFLYAPARCYGRPDDLRAFVDAAHERGLAVILDVVYNHLGPDGNYLARYAKRYFDPARHTPWGQAFHLSGPDSRPVREFFLGNVSYWLDEFRFDGLRLDATHMILDDSPRHVLADMAEIAHARGAFLIAEDDRNTSQLLRRADGSGQGIDAAWADDFHHQLRVALTGVRHAYFASYEGTIPDLVRTLRHGWFFRGQPYPAWNMQPRGEDGDHLPPAAFVCCIENHDQIGNRARGERLEHLTSPAAFRAASALLALGPYPPLLFMGQEWAAATPFLFFTDHHGELGRLVSEGRRREFADFHAHEPATAGAAVPDPQDGETFLASKLGWDELVQPSHAEVLALYRACLASRRAWLDAVATERRHWTVAAVGEAVVLRYHAPGRPERLVVAALKGRAPLSLVSEPALAPPAGWGWRLELDSNDFPVDGAGRLPPDGKIDHAGASLFPVESLVFEAPGTVLLVAVPRDQS